MDIITLDDDRDGGSSKHRDDARALGPRAPRMLGRTSRVWRIDRPNKRDRADRVELGHDRPCVDVRVRRIGRRRHRLRTAVAGRNANARTGPVSIQWVTFEARLRSAARGMGDADRCRRQHHQGRDVRAAREELLRRWNDDQLRRAVRRPRVPSDVSCGSAFRRPAPRRGGVPSTGWPSAGPPAACPPTFGARRAAS